MVKKRLWALALALAVALSMAACTPAGPDGPQSGGTGGASVLSQASEAPSAGQDAPSGGQSASEAPASSVEESGAPSAPASSSSGASQPLPSGSQSADRASSAAASSRPSSAGAVSGASSSGATSSGAVIDLSSPLALSDYYYRGRLNENQRRLYDALSVAAQGLKTEAWVAGCRLTQKECNDAITAYLLDHPETFFWNLEKMMITSGANVKVEIVLRAEPAEIQRMQIAIQERTRAALALLDDGMTEFEAECILHDWIIDQTDYQLGEGDDAWRAHSIVGVLLDGAAVCEGYANAFQYLLNLAGMQAFGVTGVATSGSGSENHKWNIVRIDGEYYQVDVTWDDPISQTDPSEKIRTYRYFNCTTQEMARDHTLDGAFSLPNCTAVQYNYYEKNGLTCTQEDYESRFIRAVEFFAARAREEGRRDFTMELKCVQEPAQYLALAETLFGGEKHCFALLAQYNRLYPALAVESGAVRYVAGEDSYPVIRVYLRLAA